MRSFDCVSLFKCCDLLDVGKRVKDMQGRTPVGNGHDRECILGE